MILDDISSPEDVRTLSQKELVQLCSDLRSEIIRITSKNGGHLGSNLGAVEIIVAVHHVFNCEKDKFIFDVGHQAYSHKLLTGRRAIMENLRTKNGASGFPDPLESPYDHFISGHASTSISAAIGIAKARDLSGENFNIISILGDGALSGGMIYEAMNNVAGIKKFVVILNDNQMSISESVGSMRKYLSKLLASKRGLSFRRRVSKLLSFLPKNYSKKIEAILKNLMSAFGGVNVFEEFGFQYIGPIDGHNLLELIKTFKSVRDVANYKPVMIHVVTRKGFGYQDAEDDAIKLHGVGKTRANDFYCDVFARKIVELAEHDKKILCITAAMKTGCGLTEFAKKFPNRFFDVGIAEEHAITFAAGLASRGFKPFVCIYSTFLQRGFDQLYHDVFLQNLPVKFIIDKAGVPGPDGKTHAGIYDLSLLQNFPNFILMAPSSKCELNSMLEFACENNSAPCAIRFPKTTAPEFQNACRFSMRSNVVSVGEGASGKILVVSIGNMLGSLLEAVNILKITPTIIDARFLNPFDFDTFYKHASNCDSILVLEEGVFGGFSNIIISGLVKNDATDLISKIKFINLTNVPISHAPRTSQLDASSLSVEKLVEVLQKAV